MGSKQQLNAGGVATDTGIMQRGVAVDTRRVDAGMCSKQKLYTLRLTKTTSDRQAKAEIGVLRNACVLHVLQQARDFAVIVLLNSGNKYRVFHVVDRQRQSHA